MTRIIANDYEEGKKAAWLGIVSNILLFALKMFAGIVGRSQAMIADAVHTASDTFTSLAVAIGFKIAQKPADSRHPFGHGKAESIAAKIVSLVLILVGVFIAYKSARILVSGQVLPPRGIALIMGFVSVVVKEITYRYVMLAGDKIDSNALRADAYHHRSDVLSSVAAIIGITGAMLGWTFMDPLAGIVVAGFILKMGMEAFHAAYDDLMDAAAPESLNLRIKEVIRNCKGVDEIRKVMVRKSGIELFVEVTIGVDGRMTVEDGHRITMCIRRDIFKSIPRVRETIVHVEPGITNRIDEDHNPPNGE
ncbi:MAG: cation diffusion facilitator family transporter [Candidatus Omnitrophica bacterium]|nr:cation diffusion facilitator family transporter [Candidatus Omnitrophota bacterium]MBU1128613.1 cation diffusion facilitator family transporter [Candidatus Omnitrophota bacterium]MBU1784371.1 cation diffusion facilitator family transporter [Candidatus Omnitrophota bacterium]MBU1852174.1 cation diffusion facilitator family transporter [Candidatus Omnitrophota bacterium]